MIGIALLTRTSLTSSETPPHHCCALIRTCRAQGRNLACGMTIEDRGPSGGGLWTGDAEADVERTRSTRCCSSASWLSSRLPANAHRHHHRLRFSANCNARHLKFRGASRLAVCGNLPPWDPASLTGLARCRAIRPAGHRLRRVTGDADERPRRADTRLSTTWGAVGHRPTAYPPPNRGCCITTTSTRSLGDAGDGMRAEFSPSHKQQLPDVS